jgi:glutamate dehydrogenase
VPRFIYDIGLLLDVELDRAGRSRFRDAILAAWNGQVESDGLARHVVTAGLTWREVVILRGYARYMVQIGIKYSYLYLVNTLNSHHEIARRLVTLFCARFDPEKVGEQSEAEERAAILDAIDGVVSLDADIILREFAALMDATIRTNHWQTNSNGENRPALALKLDPRRIPNLPRPVPTAEIFVYSPRSEGVHLRSGRVARGGLRWSDRMEDFRTEILGLMKAQTVKNSVIVPVGAKGGFVARQLPPAGTREEIMAEVVDCYRTFVNALLDVTDNIVEGERIPPTQTVRHDPDDPYLVVAADKGTATFSDTANEIAIRRGFWLDDAFASGGSDGYDHKALGITARGAWVSVERHFREMGIDVDTNQFSAVGVGDMSGDVFGNGMLRSPKTRLIAAFDHRHIFIDPHPHSANSFAERQRLYDLPRSSWDDYNRELISAGGGVFPRSAKSINVTPEMRLALGLAEATGTATPDELIRAVLCAPVDLLWNGGIGTYIKSSSETDVEIGDRSNDNVRVDANELRCKVVAEGGNLGVSQRGRIEFAANGGRINTDAIDNSAGVDCSDHEVNLKILLALAERNGDLTRKQRNQLLGSMADAVCANVLDNNYSQNESLSAAQAQAKGMVQVHARVMGWLEREALLDRAVEALPSDAEMVERREAGAGLTRPELAVLLAYTKNLLTERLAASDLASDPACSLFLDDYFPEAVRESHQLLIVDHPLREELIATLVANHMVNRGGISMTPRLMEETSATESDIAIAHIAATRIFDLDALWSHVRSLDNLVPTATQTQIDLAIRRLGERATRWLLRNEPQPIRVSDVVGRYAEGVSRLHQRIEMMEQPEDIRGEFDRYVEAGVPAEFAAQAATLGTAFGFLDLLTVAERTGIDLNGVAALHAVIEEELDLSWLRESVISLPRDDHWQTMARSALRDQYFGEHAQLTATVLESTSAYAEESAETRVARWLEQNAVAVARCRRTFADIKNAAEPDLAHASVAVRALSQLTHTV